MLVVVSKIKSIFKSVGLRTSMDFAEALSEELQDVLIWAAKAAKAEGRGTVKPRDLPKIVLKVQEQIEE